MRINWGIFAVMAPLLILACSGDDLDGPERKEFADINRLSVFVDHGDVTVFGSGQVQGAIVDRWSSSASTFDELRERNTGGELVIDSRCKDARSCRVRYDVAVERSTEVQARVDHGTLQLNRLGQGLGAEVENGSLVARGLETPFADITIEQGDVRLEFVEPPQNLQLRIGEGSAATVFLPEGWYRCVFDTESDAISMEGLVCNPQAQSALRIEPPDAAVRFEIGFDESSSPFY